MKKRIISLALSALMLTSAMPIMNLSAAEAPAAQVQTMAVGEKYELSVASELEGKGGQTINYVAPGCVDVKGKTAGQSVGTSIQIPNLPTWTNIKVIYTIRLSDSAPNTAGFKCAYFYVNDTKEIDLTVNKGEVVSFTLAEFRTQGRGYMYCDIVNAPGTAAEFQVLSVEVMNVDNGSSVIYDCSTQDKKIPNANPHPNFKDSVITTSIGTEQITVSAAAAGASDTSVHYTPVTKTLEAGIYKIRGSIKTAADSEVKVAALDADKVAIGGADFTIDTTADQWTVFEQNITVTDTVTFSGISVDAGSDAYGIRALSFECISVFEDAVLHNLITDGDCDTGIPAGLFDTGNYTLKWDEHGYVVASARAEGNVPVVYAPVIEGGIDDTHTYLFSFRIRTSSGNNTTLRLRTHSNAIVARMIDDYTTDNTGNLVVTPEWQTVTIKVAPSINWKVMQNKELLLNLYGVPGGCLEYQLDGFTLIDVTAVTGTGYENLITDGHCTNGIPEGMADGLGALVHHEDGYVITPDRAGNGVSTFSYTTNVEGGLDPTRTYRLSFSLRSGEPYANSTFRFYDVRRGAVTPVGYANNVVTLSNTWQTVAFEISPETNPTLMNGGQITVLIAGYMGNAGIFHIDDLKLIDITPTEVNEPKKNLIENGSFNEGTDADAIVGWSDELAGARITTEYVADNRVIALRGRDVSDKAVKFEQDIALEKGHTYRLLFKVRMQDKTATDTISLYTNLGGTTIASVVPRDNMQNTVNVNGVWQTVIVEINDGQNSAFYDADKFNICFYGNEDGTGFGALFIDDFVLLDVTPSDLGMPNLGVIMLLLKKRSGEWTEPEVLPEENVGEVVYTNLIEDADSAEGISKWATNGQILEAKTEGNTAYVAASGITTNYVGFTYKSGVTLQPGNYKFSCKIRTSVKGETSTVRAYNPVDSSATFLDIDNSWKELTFDMTVTAPMEFTVKICGGMQADFTQSYDISEITLINKAGNAVPGAKPPAGGNLIADATSAAALGSWTTSGQILEAKKEGKTDYLAASGITTNYVGFTYKSGVTLQPGNYEFSCKVRTSVKGDTTSLRAVNLLDNQQTFVNVNNSWTEIKYSFTVSAAGEYSVRICGGMNAAYVQPYDISDMKLTKVG